MSYFHTSCSLSPVPYPRERGTPADFSGTFLGQPLTPYRIQSQTVSYSLSLTRLSSANGVRGLSRLAFYTDSISYQFPISLQLLPFLS